MAIAQCETFICVDRETKWNWKKKTSKRQEEKQNLEHVTNMCFVKHTPASALVHWLANSAQAGPREWRKQVKVNDVLYERWKIVFE